MQANRMLLMLALTTAFLPLVEAAHEQPWLLTATRGTYVREDQAGVLCETWDLVAVVGSFDPRAGVVNFTSREASLQPCGSVSDVVGGCTYAQPWVECVGPSLVRGDLLEVRATLYCHEPNDVQSCRYLRYLAWEGDVLHFLAASGYTWGVDSGAPGDAAHDLVE